MRLGFVRELENLAGDAKGKGTRAENPRPKEPTHRPGADFLRSSDEAR